METREEGVLVITKDKRPTHMVRRSEESKSQVFYKLVECGMDDIKEVVDDAISFIPKSHDHEKTKS